MKRHCIIYGMAPWLGAFEKMEWGLGVESFLMELKKIETHFSAIVSVVAWSHGVELQWGDLGVILLA